MTTRNLVPRATNEGKIGIASKKWAEVNATNAIFSTIKVSNLKLDSISDLDLFTNGPGIKEIAANDDSQLVISISDSFLSDLGFNADGSRSAFTSTTTILANDSITTAINKLDAAVGNVNDPANLDITNFNSTAIITSAEAFEDNDTSLMTSAAIDDRILSYGYTTNTGDITSIISGTGLDLNGGPGDAGDVTIKLSDTTITPGSYGSATQIPIFTVDQQGRLTAASSASISTSFNIEDDAETPANYIFNVGETLTFSGGTALSTAVTDNKVTVSLDDTSVAPGDYGSATQIPIFTVDQQGRLTAASAASISTTLNIVTDDENSNAVELSTDTLSLLGGVGITSTNTGDNVTFNLDDTTVTADQYGDANSVAQFTVDSQGRITQAESIDISITSSQISDATSINTFNAIVKRDENGDFTAGTITANLTGNSTSSDTADKWDTGRTVTFAGGDVTGSFEIDGSANVNGVVLTIGLDSVALGANTSGDYVESLSAGTGISLLNNSGEGSTPTISVDGVLEDLDTLGAAESDGQFIVATGAGTFAYESGETVRTSLGLGTSDNPVFAGLTLENQGGISLKEQSVNGENSITIKSPASLIENYELTLPTNDGNENEVLITDGSGNLSWTTVEAAAGAAVNAFSIIAVSGQDSLVADVAQDTLNISSGNGISVTTNNSNGTDTLIVSASNISNSEISNTAEIVDTKLATISTANKVSLTSLDIDSATDIEEDLSDDDLIIVDNGGIGINRKSSISRFATYINDNTLITSLSSLSSIGSIGDTLTAEGNVTVTGNLTVNGSQFVVDGTTVQLDDNLIELGLVSGAEPVVATTKDLGLILHRHDGVSSSKLALYWDESSDKFILSSGISEADGIISGGSTQTLVANIEGNVTGQISTLSNHTTDNLSEGAANLYFTSDRVRSAITVTDAGGDGSLSYVDGEITYTGPSAAETRAHFTQGTGITLTDGEISIGQSVDTTGNVTFNQVTANLVGNVTGQISDLSNHTTDDLSEGDTNLYHTVERVRSAITVTDSGGDGSLSYVDGEITYTGPSAAETRAHFSGGTGVTLTDGEISIGQSVDTTDNVTFNQVTASLIGNANTATSLSASRSFSISGPVTSNSVNFDGSEDVVLNSNIANGAILHEMIQANIPDTSLAVIESTNKVSTSALNISGSVAVNESLTTSDLFIIEDVAVIDNVNNSTGKKKATLNNLVSFLQTNFETTLTSLNSLTSASSLSTVGTISSGVWQGSAISNTYIADNLTIDNGQINNTVIGGSTAAAGTFTNLTVNTGFVIDNSTAIVAIDTDLTTVSASDDTLATAKSIKSYVDSKVTSQSLSVNADSGDPISIDLDTESLSVQGGTGISTTVLENSITLDIDDTIATLTGLQTLENKTLTSPQVTDLILKDSSITFEGSEDNENELTLTVDNPTSDVTVTIQAATDTLVGRATVDTLTNKSIDSDNNTITNLDTTNLRENILDTDLTTVSTNDDTLASAKAIKAYVDGQLGRFGGIFLTDDVGGGEYDVVFDSSPLVRSHFGPFAFDLGQLHASGGSDIIFYGSTATGSSDRHFLVIGTGEFKGDCLFTGADENTP